MEVMVGATGAGELFFLHDVSVAIDIIQKSKIVLSFFIEFLFIY